MSKMSQLHAELTQEAYDLGFDSLEDALNHGYVPEYEGGKLVPTEEIMKQAHEAWLKEKAEVVRELKLTLAEMGFDKNDTTVYYNRIARALKFIEEGEK